GLEHQRASVPPQPNPLPAGERGFGRELCHRRSRSGNPGCGPGHFAQNELQTAHAPERNEAASTAVRNQASLSQRANLSPSSVPITTTGDSAAAKTHVSKLIPVHVAWSRVTAT